MSSIPCREEAAVSEAFQAGTSAPGKGDSRKVRKILVGIVRLSLGVLFLYSSLHKIREPYSFLSSVYSFQLVGPGLGVWIAVCLPWLELMLGLCLMVGLCVGGALLGCLLLLVTFTLAQGSALSRDLPIVCGCFGGSSETVSYLTFARTVLLFLVALAGFAVLMPGRSPDRRSGLPRG
jgi:uncharacterized membrane protein YphA (DoxX/SURF4 family)